MFFTAFRWKFIVLQIKEGEVILRIIMHLFPIQHFVVQSMLKYLIARENSQKFTSYVSRSQLQPVQIDPHLSQHLPEQIV